MERDFDNWLSTFRKSIASYRYYTDFNKVYTNVDANKIEFSILNSLIGEKDIKNKFFYILSKYPECLKCIPILLAVRQSEISAQDEDGAFTYDFSKLNLSIEQYAVFMEKTGLFDLISNHIVNNLIDYVMGVEVGLDSNGRKNRGGNLMADLVESFIKKAGYIKNSTYYKEMYSYEIEKKFGLDLSAITHNRETKKRFDFLVISNNEFYGIEVNFYTSNGSKLNETARSYKMLAEESRGIKNFHFMWFTDGEGWKSAKNNLKETFDILPLLFNINDLENDILKKI